MELAEAAEDGNLAAVNRLLAAGADVHALDDLALRWASFNGHLAVVQALLAAGARVHANNDYALRQASENGHLAVVQTLLAAGADVHANNDYALRWASRNGHIAVVQALLAAGADVHADDDYALRYASSNGHTDVVAALQRAAQAPLQGWRHYFHKTAEEYEAEGYDDEGIVAEQAKDVATVRGCALLPLAEAKDLLLAQVDTLNFRQINTEELKRRLAEEGLTPLMEFFDGGFTIHWELMESTEQLVVFAELLEDSYSGAEDALAGVRRRVQALGHPGAPAPDGRELWRSYFHKTAYELSGEGYTEDEIREEMEKNAAVVRGFAQIPLERAKTVVRAEIVGMDPELVDLSELQHELDYYGLESLVRMNGLWFDLYLDAAESTEQLCVLEEVFTMAYDGEVPRTLYHEAIVAPVAIADRRAIQEREWRERTRAQPYLDIETPRYARVRTENTAFTEALHTAMRMVKVRPLQGTHDDPSTQEPIEPGALYVMCARSHPQFLMSVLDYCKQDTAQCAVCPLCRSSVSAVLYLA